MAYEYLLSVIDSFFGSGVKELYEMLAFSLID